MNKVLQETTTKYRWVLKKALTSKYVNSESLSNKIDESDMQYEKDDEQRS
jgi:hypothetical protein